MQRRTRLPTLLALACALVLRMLVPSGWMPAANAHGFLAIEPCPSAVAPIVMLHSMHGDAHHHSHDANPNCVCGFAPLSAGLTLADTAPALEPSPTAEAQPSAPDFLRPFANGPPAPPPPSTGPPALT